MPEKKGRKGHIIEKALWQHCPIHNIDYPAGETCPQCARARVKATES